MQIDSADVDSAKRITEAAINRWGQLDLIVNNSGAGQPMPSEVYDAETIKNMSQVNIIAPSLLIKEGHAALRETKGAIVNIGTAVSRNAVPMLAHYGATKAALEHLTQSWAVEMASDSIRVNAIAPGPVKSGALTGMMGLPKDMAKQIEEQEAAQIPLGRRGTTDDIVPWILRLGNSSNEWLTGQILTIDGGWSLRS
jgi:NAD(P)-dependent dehydrogenase (short-subunit alcohol dehydrogenase family)